MDSTHDLYRQIESRYGFPLPPEYRQMKARGWFDFVKGDRPYFNPAGQSYLWLNEMEWMPLEGVREHKFPDYCKPGFVPFAFTGGGDYWCWYPEQAIDGVTPVVHCPRDSNTAEFYAPHLLGALYRQVLDFAQRVDNGDEVLARQHLKRWLDDLGPLFPSSWRETIATLHIAPLKSYEYGRQKHKLTGLLLPDEYRSIVQRDLAFAKLDETFLWMIGL